MNDKYDKKLDFVIYRKGIFIMRILFLGDVVGVSGCSKILKNLKSEIEKKN